MPIRHGLKTPLRPGWGSGDPPAGCARRGLLNVQHVKRLQTEHLADRVNQSHVLWSKMVCADWRRRWMA